DVGTARKLSPFSRLATMDPPGDIMMNNCKGHAEIWSLSPSLHRHSSTNSGNVEVSNRGVITYLERTIVKKPCFMVDRNRYDALWAFCTAYKRPHRDDSLQACVWVMHDIFRSSFEHRSIGLETSKPLSFLLRLSQTIGPNVKVIGLRVKHIFGGDGNTMVVPDLQTFPKCPLIQDCPDYEGSRVLGFVYSITRASNPQLHFGNPDILI
ncbi:hypothetical protein Tco_0370448, partial [Tanacetum coccineum]